MSDALNTMGEQVLKALGLDRICVQVYLAIHSMPAADTTQLAEHLGLAEPEILDAMDELSDLTLLRPGLSSAKLRAVSIDRALHTLLRQQADQLTIQSDALASMQSAMKELLASRPNHENSPGHIDIEAVTGVDMIQSSFEELTLRASESVSSIMPGGPVARESLEAAKLADEELIRRGIVSRAVYQTSIKSDHRTMEYVRWLGDLGAQVRLAPVLVKRVLIIDGATAVLTHKQPQLPREMFIIREPGILAPLVELFEQTWAAAEPLDSGDSSADGAMPTPQELALLKLLAAGSTDEAVGKKLGVSVRTVRRIMADLMERLGASSRFEAGHKATQRGWL